MIYFQTKDFRHLIILEPSNIKHLKEGDTVHTPDNPSSVILLYTPDIIFVASKLKDAFEKDELDVEKVENILKEELNRPEVYESCPWAR